MNSPNRDSARAPNANKEESLSEMRGSDEYSNANYEKLVDTLEPGVRHRRYARNAVIGAAGVGLPAWGAHEALSGDEPKK